MMMKRYLLRLVLCLTYALPFAVAAQGEVRVIPLGGNVEISVPDHWTFDINLDDDFTVGGDGLYVTIFPPENITVTRGLDLEAASDTADALGILGVPLAQLRIAPADVVELQAGERTASAYAGPERDGVQKMLVVLPVGDSYGALLFRGTPSALAEGEAVIADILASFDVAATAGVPPDSEPAGLLPDEGLWMHTFDETLYYTCEGRWLRLPFNTDLFYPTSWFQEFVSVVHSDAFTVGRDLFLRDGTSDSFTGQFTDRDANGIIVVSDVRYDVISGTHMTGQIVTNVQVQRGRVCGITVAFDAQRNE